MQSKFLPRNLLSYKTLLIAVPGLFVMIAIATILTSITTGRDSQTSNRLKAVTPSEVQNQNSLNPVQPTSPVIAAKSLEKKQPSTHVDSSQTAVNATPLRPNSATQSTPNTKSSNSNKFPPQPSPKKQAAAQPARSTQAVPARPSSSPQSVLTMKGYEPTAVKDVPNIPIRVAIVRGAQGLRVATSEAGIITDATGKVMANMSAQGAIEVSWQLDRIKAGSVESQSSLWIRPKTESGLVFVNDRWYRGVVEIIADQGTLLAVNHVEMQPYLYSVVGAEMYHSWPAHALKAQAIAARSYALVHIVRPASPHFDLGSTQRWQAYKGVDSEAATTQSAVDKTRGIVISYQGGIVESLYASSSELVRDAHKGFGMSQYGARDLARQDLSYRQILNRFYPGTDLSLLQYQ